MKVWHLVIGIFLAGYAAGNVWAVIYPAAFCRAYGAVVAWLHCVVAGPIG